MRGGVKITRGRGSDGASRWMKGDDVKADLWECQFHRARERERETEREI